MTCPDLPAAAAGAQGAHLGGQLPHALDEGWQGRRGGLPLPIWDAKELGLTHDGAVADGDVELAAGGDGACSRQSALASSCASSAELAVRCMGSSLLTAGKRPLLCCLCCWL